MHDAPPVLVVEDEPLVRRSLVRELRALGFEAEGVGTATQALERADERPFPLVVVDIGLPDLDGLALTRELGERHPDAQFVIITGLPRIDLSTDRCLALNVVAFLPKPWDTPTLGVTLSEAWERRQRRSERPADRASLVPRLLLLENEDADADSLIAHLTEAGVAERESIVRVRELGDALDALEQDRFSVVMTALDVPDARGLDAVLRLQTFAPEAPLIVLDEADDPALAARAVHAGAQDVLVKDQADPRTLGRAVRYAIERKASEQRLVRLAHHDALTGLANRELFQQRLRLAIARARRAESHLAVMFVDLDRFKQVNDTLGHAAGDALLVEVAERILGCVRDYDTVARLGGDEFAVLLDSLGSGTEVEYVAERVLARVSDPIRLEGTEVAVSASIGSALFPESGQNAPALLKEADRAMYRAKARGRNTHCTSRESGSTALRELRLASELRRALDRGQLRVVYQPQHALSDDGIGPVVGFEALLRWERQPGVFLSSRDFVPQLEETGQILEVGAWVLRTALLERQGLEAGRRPAGRIAVNLSARQLEYDGIVDLITEALEEAEAPPSWLELEVTEAGLLRNPDAARRRLNALAEMGVSIAIDDFGTGYCSLAHLHHFPISGLKIDGSFIRRMCASAESQAMVSSILNVGRILGVRTTAEHVETEGQLERLLHEGCDAVQGYLTGRPLSPEQLNQWWSTTAITVPPSVALAG